LKPTPEVEALAVRVMPGFVQVRSLPPVLLVIASAAGAVVSRVTMVGEAELHPVAV